MDMSNLAKTCMLFIATFLIYGTCQFLLINIYAYLCANMSFNGYVYSLMFGTSPTCSTIHSTIGIMNSLNSNMIASIITGIQGLIKTT